MNVFRVVRVEGQFALFEAALQAAIQEAAAAPKREGVQHAGFTAALRAFEGRVGGGRVHLGLRVGSVGESVVRVVEQVAGWSIRPEREVVRLGIRGGGGGEGLPVRRQTLPDTSPEAGHFPWVLQGFALPVGAAYEKCLV